MSVELRPVTDDEAEIRLDRWFRRHFPAVTQGAIQKLCRTGQIRVDGDPATLAGKAGGLVQRKHLRVLEDHQPAHEGDLLG